MELVERARGLMTGIAVGNLLGIPWEGKPSWLIADMSGGGVTRIEAREGYPDDDDLAQAILLAEACLEGGDLDVADLADRFWAWGELNGAGMGGLTGRVLTNYGGHYPRRALRRWVRFDEPPPAGGPRAPLGMTAIAASQTAWESRPDGSAGNGSVMRCGAVALRWMHDDVSLARNSVTSAVVTHWDWHCTWSTLLADFAIAACLRQERVEADSLLERAGAALAADPGVGAVGWPSRKRRSWYGLPAEPPKKVRPRGVVHGSRARRAEIDDSLELGEAAGRAWQFVRKPWIVSEG